VKARLLLRSNVRPNLRRDRFEIEIEARNQSARHKVVTVALTRLLMFISVDLVTAFFAHISVV
jgi:hypothetical protein